MGNQKIIAIIIIGITLAFATGFAFPQGERIAQGQYQPGFPFGFMTKSAGETPNHEMPAAEDFTTKILPVQLLADLVFWIVIAVLITTLIGGIKGNGGIKQKIMFRRPRQG